MSVKQLPEHHLELLSLKGGCTGSSEFTLVKIPHCWKSRVTAQIYYVEEGRQLFLEQTSICNGDLGLQVLSVLSE